MQSEVLEIRQLRFPLLFVSELGLLTVRSRQHFNVVAREYYERGEGDEELVFASDGKKHSIAATRIYDLAPIDRFLHRAGFFFIGKEWKMAVRCEIDCKIEDKLSFDEFCSFLMELLLTNKSWWHGYNLTEHDIRTIFDGCTTIKDAMKAVKIIGMDYKPKPGQKSKIFQDLTVKQRLE